ncbi:DsbC/DsbD-like thiol-disulfide interchange protein [Sagittula marina]|uniref:DsbC/DsbD-like thiol-disulfide interchange protein n=1 Tax=Sagittula marina TaxID=943940 RepID=A0A7W6GQX0_9RHOB|nr:protein-disulfide reductase DsbD domain-containing protein [Sagittula marina]MBB3984290.1 DsbC/DsbD-like thiol-disulfide interchange protein [Sagittula marina]
MTKIFAALLLSLLPMASQAESFDGQVRATLLPGWRLSNGDHVAALRLELADGWKTYWRSPGDAGIPPSFDWSGSRNLDDVTVSWPSPDVFWQSGMRSVGYKHEVILPLRVDLRNGARDARLSGTIDIGICKDVCLPQRLTIQANLPAAARKPDARIAAAMADLPYRAADAGITRVHCQVSAAERGLGLTVALDMPGATGREETVIEFPDPELWVADPETSIQNGQLVSQTRVSHTSRAAFALDRSAMTITVLGGPMPVEIRGCD